MNARIVALLCVLWSPLLVAAQAGLDVSITKLEAGKEAILHLQNNTGKDVAAFNVKLAIRHADGQVTQSGAIADFGYRATRSGDPKRGVPKLLVAGESYDERVALASDEIQVTPKLGAVIYADRSAQGDEDSVQELVENRQKFAEYMGKHHPNEATKATRYAKDDLRRQP